MGQPLMLAFTLSKCRVGFALVALADPNGARTRLRWALEQVQATEAKSLALLALSGIGVLLARGGRSAGALSS